MIQQARQRKMAVLGVPNTVNVDLNLLKCTSAYPTPLHEVNLRSIPTISSQFDILVGLSDHTPGIAVPVAAVALGACMIEKHLTLDRSLGGPDAKFSLEPDEFRHLVSIVRETEEALGQEEYVVTETMQKSREFSRSLFITQDIEKGEALTIDNVRSIRPGISGSVPSLP